MSKLSSLIHSLTYKYPNLKRDLRTINSKYNPETFILRTIKGSLTYGLLFTVLFYLVFSDSLSIVIIILLFPLFTYLFYKFSFLKIKGKIKSLEREINKEVLFIGRYLLVKLYSGRPLLNALIETSNSRGIIARSIKDIVNNIDTGTPIEKALDDVLNYSPSEKFKKILFQVNNALKLGIDVTRPLEAALAEIAEEQEIEVKKYGKKLNSLVVFYMLMAIVMPSIGMVMFIIIASFLGLPLDFWVFVVIIFFVSLIQILFISLFKSIRPMVNL